MARFSEAELDREGAVIAAAALEVVHALARPITEEFRTLFPDISLATAASAIARAFIDSGIDMGAASLGIPAHLGKNRYQQEVEAIRKRLFDSLKFLHEQTEARTEEVAAIVAAAGG